jgi:hypothetical protein
MTECSYDLGEIKYLLDTSGLSQPEIMEAIQTAAKRKPKTPTCTSGCEKGCQMFTRVSDLQ